MDLFKPIAEETRRNKNFSSVLTPLRRIERELLCEWANGFVDRDGKFVEEFQTTFNSSFWEIYLYAVFKKLGITVDWSHASPDFSLRSGQQEFVVEAVTANAAIGKPNEWDRTFSQEELDGLKRFRKLNTEAMIRLSNAILSKIRKYETSYGKMDHVKKRPFLLAIAPFEQPHFILQHDRPIRAVLYDHYVDEDVYLDNPDAYPDGPPSVKLGFVEKENGAEVPLGLFADDGMPEVSAVIFSCTATWGKLSAMAKSSLSKATVKSMWSTPPSGAPVKKECDRNDHDEGILDGLQVYHNPFARYPLAPEIMRGERVVQHYVNADGVWVYENAYNALLWRQVLITAVSGADAK